MIYIDKKGKEPLYLQIYRQVRQEILSGVRKEGEILPGSRSLASILQVSRNTVDNAYSQLVAEGYLVPQKGIGYQVVAVPRLMVRQQKESIQRVMKQTKSVKEQKVIYDLTNGSHSNDLFPKILWRKATLECLDRLEYEGKLSTLMDKQGEWYLRSRLLSYLRRIRGIQAQEEQMIITCGLQQSLEIVCKIMYNQDVVVIMEEPGYHKARTVFENNGYQILSVPVDENGIMVSELPAEQGNYLLYSTPSHQFPTGVTMSIARRMKLLSWAKEMGAYILEDDFDSELRYYAKPVPSLQSIDTHNHVIYLGTFSKILSPSIRMGYMILPEILLECYLEQYENYNCMVPLLNQYVVARLLETGDYERQVRRMNHIFRKRLQGFESEFVEMGGKLKITGNGSGQYFLLEFSSEVTQEELIQSALNQGVRVYPTMLFWREKADCPPSTLFLGFSKIKLEDIHDCIQRLKVAWERWLI